MSEGSEDHKPPRGRWRVDDNLRGRLAECWAKSDIAGFYGQVLEELVPRVRRFLESWNTFDDDEIDEFINIALERFEERQSKHRASIRDPYNYFYSIAVNAAYDMFRDRESDAKIVEIAADVAGYERRRGRAVSTNDEEDQDWPEDRPQDAETEDPSYELGEPDLSWAVALIEGTSEEVEAEASWAVLVVKEAISRLAPMQQRVIRHIAEHDFDFLRKDFALNSQRASAELGISPAAYRKNKQRAYQSLKTLIPKVIRELRIEPPIHVAEAIFAEEPGSFPSDQDDD